MLRITRVSFPGLGIGEFRLNSVAFTVFGHPIAWYGIIITTGIILATLYVLYRARHEHIPADDIIDLGIYVIFFGVLGARMYFVLTSLRLFDSFWDIFKIWEGGLAIYGGVIAGALTIIIFCRIKKRDFLQFFDMVAPAVMIGQMVGRWGNFMNGEAHGGITDIFCRMGLAYGEYGKMYYYHPTFIYEALWNLLGFILINLFYKKKRYNGQIAFMYFAWYGFGRMLIEQLRTDSLYILAGVFGEQWFLKISSLVGLFSFLIFGGLLLYHAIKKTRRATAFHTADGQKIQ